MTKLNIKKILNDFPTFDEHIQEELKDKETQKEYLKIHLEDYAKDGDYVVFFKALERVIKARTSISQFAIDIDVNRSNLSNILKGKVQPSFDTTMKILRGLGAEFEIRIA